LSVQATNWVIQNSRHKGSELLCLIMIADCAGHDGGGAWPSIDTLAKRCRMSTRQIVRVLQKLEQSGEVIIERGAGPYGTHKFTLPLQSPLPGVGGDKLSGVTNQAKGGDKLAPKGVTPVSPEPSINHQEPSDTPQSRFDRFAKEYPARPMGRNEAEARKKHIKLFGEKQRAEAIIAGAKRYRLMMEHLGQNGTKFVAQMTTWLNQSRWHEPYAVVELQSEKPAAQASTKPVDRVDYVLRPFEGGVRPMCAKDPRQPFDARGWFESRQLKVTREWAEYVEAQE
jgi:hypothetical protein